MRATVALSGSRVKVPVMDINTKTIWVALWDGNIIKRHNVKHGVVMHQQRGVTFEPMVRAPRRSLWTWLVGMVRRLFGR